MENRDSLLADSSRTNDASRARQNRPPTGAARRNLLERSEIWSGSLQSLQCGRCGRESLVRLRYSNGEWVQESIKRGVKSNRRGADSLAVACVRTCNAEFRFKLSNLSALTLKLQQDFSCGLAQRGLKTGEPDWFDAFVKGTSDAKQIVLGRDLGDSGSAKSLQRARTPMSIEGSLLSSLSGVMPPHVGISPPVKGHRL